MTKSSLAERDKSSIWHPYTQHKNAALPIPIVSGTGALLFDEEGHSYIDAVSSWWVNIHGHAHPYIAEKIYQQARTLEQVIFTSFTHAPAVELAERLLSILPGQPAKIFYSDNGSTAVEVALKMAIQYWQNTNHPERKKILVFENAYHGDTFGAMSVSGRGLFTDAFKEYLFEVLVIETPHETNLQKIRSVIDAHKNQIAAFIYEPLLQAAGGMKIHESQYLNTLLEYVQQAGILCIADEVLTGFGRTGTLFASEKMSHHPDIFCLSKGLTGGTMALGVTACKQHIYEAFLSDDRTRTFFHGHSFTANPLACTAGLASLDLLQEKSCMDQIKIIQLRHEKFVESKLALIPGEKIKNIRILGTVLAFELNTGQEQYTNPVGLQIMELGLSQGIFLRPLGNTVYFMPPYCISEAELEKVYAFLLSIPSAIRIN